MPAFTVKCGVWTVDDWTWQRSKAIDVMNIIKPFINTSVQCWWISIISFWGYCSGFRGRCWISLFSMWISTYRRLISWISWISTFSRTGHNAMASYCLSVPGVSWQKWKLRRLSPLLLLTYSWKTIPETPRAIGGVGSKRFFYRNDNWYIDFLSVISSNSGSELLGFRKKNRA